MQLCLAVILLFSVQSFATTAFPCNRSYLLKEVTQWLIETEVDINLSTNEMKKQLQFIENLQNLVANNTNSTFSEADYMNLFYEIKKDEFTTELINLLETRDRDENPLSLTKQYIDNSSFVHPLTISEFANLFAYTNHNVNLSSEPLELDSASAYAEKKIFHQDVYEPMLESY